MEKVVELSCLENFHFPKIQCLIQLESEFVNGHIRKGLKYMRHSGTLNPVLGTILRPSRRHFSIFIPFPKIPKLQSPRDPQRRSVHASPPKYKSTLARASSCVIALEKRSRRYNGNNNRCCHTRANKSKSTLARYSRNGALFLSPSPLRSSDELISRCRFRNA